MGKKTVIILALITLTFNLEAQNWTKNKAINLRETITAQSVDPDGKVYLGTANGNIFRYEANGDESEFYSEIANFPVTQINAWNRFKTFVYFQNPQMFVFINRFNTTPQNYQLSEYGQELATLTTPGIDNSIWILSTGYNELKKYNLQNKQLSISNPLSLNLNKACYMRAHQNLLIIADPVSGLHFFDQYGNYQKALKEKGISYFQIEEDELIYLQNDEVVIANLYKPEVKRKIKAPKGGFQSVVKSGDQFFFINAQLVEIYSLSF